MAVIKLTFFCLVLFYTMRITSIGKGVSEGPIHIVLASLYLIYCLMWICTVLHATNPRKGIID